MTNGQATSQAQFDPRGEHFDLPLPDAGGTLFLSRLAPPDWERRTRRRAVLYVHGATFPSALSIAYRFDGRSWRDALVASGYAVWGFDFLGFGRSSHYAPMAAGLSDGTPLNRAGEAARQLEAALEFITARSSVDRVSLLAHSWGSMPSGLVAARSPERIDRLVFFAPIAQRPGIGAARQTLPACRLVSLADQWRRFLEDVPEGETGGMLPRHFAVWGEDYLDSDRESRSRDSASVLVPSGPSADIADAWAGALAYDPALIRAPTLVVRGAWDRVTSEADARWLHDALRHAAERRLLKIARATHLAHLEESRYELYREVGDFLAARHTVVT
jgi:pimeloyl-ACP methyl ester carboxylesterase